MVDRSNVILCGAIGTGKTHSLRSLHKYKHVALVTTDNDPESVLGDIPCEGDGNEFHWMHVAPGGVSWATMIKVAKIVNTTSNAKMQDMENIEASKFNQFIQLLETKANFTCDRCGKAIGPLDNLDTSWAVVDDNLTGISKMGMDIVIGAKPVRTLPDWGVAMEMVHNYLFKCTGDLKASYILIAHTAREKDEITGATVVTLSTLGVKLAPKILPMFSEVIETNKDGTDFWWATTSSGVELKNRVLPISTDLDPDFGLIFGPGAAR
jgi:hypothetical protein